MSTDSWTPQDSGESGPDNVIRFPRDWFGSTDDLIPIGSAADRLEAEAAATAESERTSALNANDFWGGGTEALHEPVGAVQPRARTSAATKFRSVGAARRLSIRTVLIAVAVTLALAAVASFVLSTRSSSKAKPTVAKPTATRQTAIPRVSASVEIHGVQSLSGRQVSMAVHLIDHPIRSAVKTRSPGSRKPVSQRAHATASHERVSAANPSDSESSQPPAIAASPVSQDTDGSSVSYSSVASSHAPVTSQTSTSVTSPSDTSSTGPGGLGGAVGSNCNPTCTAN